MIDEIEKEVLERIKPSKDDFEKINNTVEEVLEALKGFEAEVHGSFRKGTWLKGDTDVDIFVFFPKELGKEYMPNALKLIEDRLRKFNYQINYAEHPYIIIKNNGMEIDVVPALRVDSGENAVTAVDRTPFHTALINSSLTDEQKDQVRLLKRFMKGIGTYGAEIKVKGFSGYVCELLILNYGSFREVLKASSDWRPPVKILIRQPTVVFDSPLIIVDPVDPRRNAASAVSLKKLGEFSIASKFYLEKPSIDFFFPPEVNEVDIKGEVLVSEILLQENVSQDVLWGQINSSVTRIRNQLKSKGFEVIDVQAYGNNEKIIIATQISSRFPPQYYLNLGPPFYVNAKGFFKKNENVWVGDDGNLYSIKKREITPAEDVVKLSIQVKHKYSLREYWLSERPKDPCLKQFLRKTPVWLK
ncbi:CCA tRNA nucleotidyltransferase [Acidianus sp. RZ1]|uniref:CCA tRNA nucleotidyltransferase n=1 Tax=Acidianus sp. RZ1 TaxID=1540082 RepID=UPI0014925508|nr:CCA tRNA nucleotidyltransferase [Acidianus sp. RZ1]NON62170.1 CCA tRNA nucleotidyltransferase [Acidianus sp. RZ1]